MLEVIPLADLEEQVCWGWVLSAFVYLKKSLFHFCFWMVFFLFRFLTAVFFSSDTMFSGLYCSWWEVYGHSSFLCTQCFFLLTSPFKKYFIFITGLRISVMMYCDVPWCGFLHTLLWPVNLLLLSDLDCFFSHYFFKYIFCPSFSFPLVTPSHKYQATWICLTDALFIFANLFFFPCVILDNFYCHIFKFTNLFSNI